MLAVALKYDSCCTFYAIIFKDSIEVRQIILCIIREDHGLSARLQIIQDLCFFFLGNIARRRYDHQAVSIVRNFSFCEKVQILDINVGFLDILFKAGIQIFFAMSG